MGINAKGGACNLLHFRNRSGLHLAALHQGHIARHALDTVGFNAAQIRPDQNIGDQICVFAAHPAGHEYGADKIPEIGMADHRRVGHFMVFRF